MRKWVMIPAALMFAVVGGSFTFCPAQANAPTTMRDPNTGNIFRVAATHPDLPTEWIDADTGHRVIRLTREDGSASLYFHQNAYTPDARKLIFTSPTGLYTIDLATRAIEQILADRNISVVVAGRKNADVYYMTGTAGKDVVNGPQRSVYCVDLNTHETRKIADIPRGGNVTTVNCDETLLCGSITYPPAGQAQIPAFRYSANGRIDIGYRLGLHLPMDLVTINTTTGEVRKFHHSDGDWLNHIQFSPTDPKLLMFCHEGPWNQVDRIWTVNIDEGQPQLVHKRTMSMEIAGHEFWSHDGKTVNYDLQTPIGRLFWVGTYNLQTGDRTWYNLKKSEWSVHFNVSPDGLLYAGDGGGPGSVARGDNGQWIYLFRPHVGRDGPSPEQGHLIHSGYFESERLVNLAKHDYALEPNVSFTPDMKWIIFRSNMLGPTHVYAVEIAKAAVGNKTE
jgi:oligogalacturonide lyase